MGTIKEEAQNYTAPKEVKNISDIEVFDVNMNIETYKGTDSEGNDFTYKYIEDKNKTRYRIPGIVIGQIKDHLEENPEQTLFKVKREGTGKTNTRYTVLPVKK